MDEVVVEEDPSEEEASEEQGAVDEVSTAAFPNFSALLKLPLLERGIQY